MFLDGPTLAGAEVDGAGVCQQKIRSGRSGMRDGTTDRTFLREKLSGVFSIAAPHPCHQLPPLLGAEVYLFS
jgi:hypothetical protein